MDRDVLSHDVLRRAAMADWVGRRTPEGSSVGAAAQRIPVNIYDTGEQIVLVAPMPGVEAENIDIEVVGTTITLCASLRGVGQEVRDYIQHEWTYGPYERTIELPVQVDAQIANASHNNGVLVVALPKAPVSTAVRVPLKQVTASWAVHEGHSGHVAATEIPNEGLQE